MIEQPPYFESLACDGIQFSFKDSKNKIFGRKQMK